METLWLLGIGVAALIFLPHVIRHVRMQRYFASEEFAAHRAELASFVAEHHDVAAHAARIRQQGLFQLGSSSSGSHAHLASTENTSRHRYRRDRHVANLQAPNVHNCSLQVVRNAAGDPLKYVMKYFRIPADEATLARVERLGDSFARLEAAVANLRQREAAITQSVKPPAFILKHYRHEFLQRTGVELQPIEIFYPVYVFEYVSAGGNSSQRTTVALDPQTIDALIERMSSTIRFRKSAAGQRALMTSRLRQAIKDRDGHACRYCKVSVAAEPHLLLEVDHIMPVSKGGLTTPENLQTLCWRCNRAKSDKIVAV